MVDRPWKKVGTAGDREYLALVSYLPLRMLRSTFAFLRFVRAVTAQLNQTRGLLGFTFRAKVLSKRYYTLSVWEDEGALMEFVSAAPHMDTMRALGPHMGETRFVRWTIAGSEVPPTWESAIARLEAEPTARHP